MESTGFFHFKVELLQVAVKRTLSVLLQMGFELDEKIGGRI
jgi:hypothetical protein